MKCSLYYLFFLRFSSTWLKSRTPGPVWLTLSVEYVSPGTVFGSLLLLKTQLIQHTHTHTHQNALNELSIVFIHQNFIGIQIIRISGNIGHMEKQRVRASFRVSFVFPLWTSSYSLFLRFLTFLLFFPFFSYFHSGFNNTHFICLRYTHRQTHVPGHWKYSSSSISMVVPIHEKCNCIPVAS